MNVLLDLFPDENWNMFLLSANPNISLQDIIERPDWGWDWMQFSGSKGISWQEIMKNKHLSWNWTIVLKRKDIVFSDALNIIQEKFFSVPIEELSYNVKWKDVKENLLFKWNWKILSKNPNITIQNIIDNSKLPWDWYCISRRPDITLDYVLENPDLHWYYENFKFPQNRDSQLNKTLTDEKSIIKFLIEKYNDRNSIWYEISSHPLITMSIVNSYPKLPWNYNGLSLNPSITWSDIRKYCYKQWNFYYISQNPSITFDIVLKYPDYPWDFTQLSRNPSITIQDIIDYPDPSKICELFLTKKWNFNCISENTFGWERDKDYKNILKLIVNFTIFSNENIPKYLMMEILQNFTKFSFYELNILML